MDEMSYYIICFFVYIYCTIICAPAERKRLLQAFDSQIRLVNYFETPPADWVHGYLCFEPGAWKWNESKPCLRANCKILISPMFKFSHSILDWTALSWNLGGIFWNIFIGPCHLQGFYSESALFYLLQSGHSKGERARFVRSGGATLSL